MQSSDMRAKARAIFGPAIAEPMPNQPNGAFALQQRANARPIPTYKVGGAVKKAGGGMATSTASPTSMRSTPSPTDMRSTASPVFMRSTASPTEMRSTPSPTRAKPPGMSSKLVKKAEGGAMKKTPPGPTAAERAASKAQDERLKKAKVTPKEGKVIGSANRSEGSMYKKGGGVMKKAAGGGMSSFGKAFADARKGGKKTFEFNGKSYTTETREDVQKRAMAASAEREKRAEAGRAAMRQKTAAGTEERGKTPFQRSTDKFYKKYPEAMKDGGKSAKAAKPKDGLAVMIAIGKPMKGMKKPVKRAVGGAGKTRKGMC
jgi:hypothetical protein